MWYSVGAVSVELLAYAWKVAVWKERLPIVDLFYVFSLPSILSIQSLILCVYAKLMVLELLPTVLVSYFLWRFSVVTFLLLNSFFFVAFVVAPHSETLSISSTHRLIQINFPRGILNWIFLTSGRNLFLSTEAKFCPPFLKASGWFSLCICRISLPLSSNKIVIILHLSAVLFLLSYLRCISFLRAHTHIHRHSLRLNLFFKFISVDCLGFKSTRHCFQRVTLWT